MKKSDQYYFSSDGYTKIHAIAWEPEGEPVGVLQICHGMMEYIDRYHDFASYLVEHGYYVVGNDHLGHGESVANENMHGYFAHPNGNECVIEDIHKLRTMTQEQFPDIPYFMLGHSMGSFLIRQYIQEYGKGLTGVIIMGTGNPSKMTLSMGKRMCKRSAKKHGWDYRDERINERAFGSYNKQFEPARTPSDWLTKDEAVVDSYADDPYCNFIFTVNGYYHMFDGIQKAEEMKRIEQIPKKLAVLFVSGAEDPVGENGKAVKKAYQTYRLANIPDVMMQLYEGDRHEVLNELDHETVYADLLTWLEVHREPEIS